MKLLLIPILFLFVLLWGITIPDEFCFDEHYYIPSARSLLAGTGWMELSHPPLGKALLALSIYLFDDSPFWWRLPSVIATVATAWYLGRIALTLGLSLFAAQLAQFVFLCDGVVFTQARVGILNAPMLCCMIAAFYYALAWKKHPRNDLAAVALAAALIGLGTGIRWVAVSAAPLLAIIFLSQPRSWSRRGGMVLIAAVVFTATFFTSLLPLLLHEDFTLARIFSLQGEQLQFHMNFQSPHRYNSPWWSWPLMLRPIWFGFERATDGSGLVRGIVAMSNPAIVWPAVPLAICLLVQSLRLRQFSLFFIGFGFLQQWMQWGGSPHSTMFHYFHTAIPFTALAIGVAVDYLRQYKIGLLASYAWVASILVLFVYWYPLLTCHWISDAYYQHHLWLHTWR